LFYSPKIITIIGPTASGKTNLSIKLAKKFNGEIINADSRLFYRGMNIGTSKPNKKELQVVKHHLINIMTPEKSNNLHDFLIDANNIIKTIIRSGKTPIIVGGTGQYIWALLEGWKLDKNPINKQLRNKLEKLDLEELQTLYYKENSSKSSDIDIQNKVTYYERDNSGKIIVATPVNNSWKWAGGGFISTTEDIINFLYSHSKSDYLSDESLNLLISPQKTVNGENTNYGIGWRTRYGNIGEVLIGHTGGSIGGTTFAFMSIEYNVILVITSNISSASFGKLPNDIFEIYY